MTASKSLPPEALAPLTDPEALGFESTDELADLEEVIGQDRAVEAVRFGIGIRQDGYNMFALGPPGVGKHTMVRQFLEQQAAREATPDDWCYVHNFEDPQKPSVLRLPAGRARPFQHEMETLIEELRAAIPTAFESEEYRARRQAIEEEMKERHEAAFGGLQRRAQERGIAMIRTPMGLALTPVRGGEVLSPEEFGKLPEEEQEKVKSDIGTLQVELEEILAQMPGWEREHRARIRELHRDVARSAVAQMIDDLRARYADLANVIAHLDTVQEDMIENARDFMRPEGGAQGDGPGGGMGAAAGPLGGLAAIAGSSPAPSFARYRVNVIVANGDAQGAPIVYEDHPIHPNLMGRIEHQSQYGALVTDFNLIRPGALHRANGGYLIVEARKLLMQPFAWEELKRALRARELRIESLGQLYSLVSIVSLEPESIPLDVKIVLLGDPQLYYLLCRFDPEFGELFKIPVDFEDRMPRDEGSVRAFARLVATTARQAGLRPLDKTAVAKVMDRAARLAEDGERLSTHLASISDLLREADYWAGERRRATVTAKDVRDAVAAQIRRSDRLRERVLEEIARGTILIDSTGEAVGQINGLAVWQLGGFAFGRPCRITARIALGRGEVVDIEREVALGGPLHSKGMLILQGFLAARFATRRPMSLKASVVFEQSYGGVDGDSASSAELYALLSALSGAPIRQGLAVTGSVNQLGQVQAIGGVNEKIEGFFDVCRAGRLTGDQGVLIPASNTKHLMLREDVVAAAAKGRFHIYAVETIDQGIEILTGVPAGEADADGAYPEGTINHRVEARLAELAEAARRFARPERAEKTAQAADVPEPTPPEPQP